MERCRYSATILPLGGFQQSTCDEGVHFSSPQLDLDARKGTPAPLAVKAHALGGRGEPLAMCLDISVEPCQNPSRPV